MIHIINPLENPFGGSENRALHLAKLLNQHASVVLWHQSPDEEFWRKQYPGIELRLLDPDSGQFPSQGCFVFAGFYSIPGDWIFQSSPSRIILVVNLDPRHFQFSQTVSRLASCGCRVDFVYASQWIAQLVQVPGVVEFSPIDIDRFSPGSRSGNAASFRVGRLSRDSHGKHHPGDMKLYRRLVQRGCSVSVMGGTVLSGAVSAKPLLQNGVELLPAGYRAPEVFLRSLDCFIYRTSPQWIEPHGRVITEAMACGLPVVAHRQGGYCDFIKHGENGFLFSSAAEALGLIERLKAQPDLCESVGLAARKTMQAMFSSSRLAAVRAYYLGSNDPG